VCGDIAASDTLITRWGEMMAMVEATEHYIRHEGHHRNALVELTARMPPPTTRAARAVRQELLECVTQQAQQLGAEERLRGSSEVIESVIGKFKYMAGERGHHGMTGMVLSIGAFVGRCALTTVQSAMKEITTHDVWQWCSEHLGTTVQGVRRRIAQALAPEHY